MTFRIGRMRVNRNFNICQKIIKIFFRHLECFTLHIFVFIQRSIKQSKSFRCNLLTFICFLQLVHEYEVRSTIKNNMMDILKEINRLRSLIYFQSVKIVIKQVERTHSILEELSRRFKIKCSNCYGH